MSTGRCRVFIFPGRNWLGCQVGQGVKSDKVTDDVGGNASPESKSPHPPFRVIHSKFHLRLKIHYHICYDTVYRVPWNTSQLRNQ